MRQQRRRRQPPRRFLLLGRETAPGHEHLLLVGCELGAQQ